MIKNFLDMIYKPFDKPGYPRWCMYIMSILWNITVVFLFLALFHVITWKIFFIPIVLALVFGCIIGFFMFLKDLDNKKIK